MNRHSPHRSPVDMRPAFLVALALYLLVAFALAMAIAPAGGPASPLHPTPGLGL